MSRVLELGAGENPAPAATETLDIREDLDHIDYKGVDIVNDSWPVEDGSIDRIIANHIFEHINPKELSHAFEEANRVLKSGGVLNITVPHAGTWEAHTDPTHMGTGGWTPDIEEYFAGGNLEGYYNQIPWDVSAKARLEFPLFIRPSLRLAVQFNRGDISNELAKLPFVCGIVEFEAVKTDRQNL